MIERSRLTEILETYGADPARWPETERAAGEAALAADHGLQALAARERLLDGWLSDWDVPAPRPAAMAALFAASRVTAQAGAEAPVQALASPPSWVRPMRRRERWLSSGGALGLAAGIVALLILAGGPAKKTPVEVTDTSMISLAFSADQSEGWL